MPEAVQPLQVTLGTFSFSTREKFEISSKKFPLYSPSRRTQKTDQLITVVRKIMEEIKEQPLGPLFVDMREWLDRCLRSKPFI